MSKSDKGVMAPDRPNVRQESHPGRLRDRSEEPIVELKEVRKEFGDIAALDSVSLTVHRGEIAGIIGPSASGKTTTIRMLLGLYEPTSGDVFTFGQRLAEFTLQDRERIGYLSQDFLLYDDLTVKENLSFAASIYGIGWLARRRRIPELLELVQLDDASGQKVSEISGGMRRRLGLACALIHEPELIVLDEPTAGLDPVLREQVWDLLRTLQQHGATFITTTQYVTESELCDVVYLINEGRVIAFGTPSELRRSAFGGDVIELVVPELDRPLVEELYGLPFVVKGTRTGNDSLELVVDHGREAIPKLTDAVTARNFQVKTIEERVVSFDRIFVTLVEESAGHDETHR